MYEGEILLIDAEHPSRLFLAQRSEVLRSIDNGHSWLHVEPAENWGAVRMVAIDPNDSNVIYMSYERSFMHNPKTGAVESYRTRVYRSQDGGTTWSFELADYNEAFTVGTHPAEPATFYVSTDVGVFITEDAGENWRRSSSSFSPFGRGIVRRFSQFNRVRDFAFSPDGQIAYAATREGLFENHNRGDSWNLILAPHAAGAELYSQEVSAVLVHPQESGVVYAATNDGLWVTRNGGMTWSRASLGPEGLFEVRGLAIHPLHPNIIVAATRDGLYRSSDGGSSWSLLLQATRKAEISRHGAPIFNDLRKPVFTRTPPYILYAIARSNEVEHQWYSGCCPYEIWFERVLSIPFSDGEPTTGDGGPIFSLGEDMLFDTMEGPHSHTIKDLEISPDDSDVVFVANWPGGLARGELRGDWLRERSSALPQPRGGLHRDVFDVPAIALTAGSPPTLIAATYAGVYVADPNGIGPDERSGTRGPNGAESDPSQAPEEQPGSPGDEKSEETRSSDGTGAEAPAGTTDGDNDGAGESGDDPFDLRATSGSPALLHQNRPNPFNADTTIPYDILESTWVDLAIYDITGKRIRTLVRGETERGSYGAVWNGTNDHTTSVASGVYLARLKTARYSRTMKLVLIR